MTHFIADTVHHTLTHVPTGTIFALPKYTEDEELAAIIFKALREIENGTSQRKTNAST